MQTLIYRKPFFSVLPHHLPSSFFFSQNLKNKDFLGIHPKNCPNTLQTLLLCSVTSPHSLSYGGWDDLQLKGDSTHSVDSNQLNNFLSYLGIGDKKYLFVYLFGFVCALAISRVKVSSIVVFPACAIVFALGFSIGLVKKGDGKELRSNGSRRKLTDENFSGFIENLRNLKDGLNGYNAKALSLKSDIRRSIEGSRITVNDLQGYIDVIESNNVAFQNALNVVDSCMHCVLRGNQENEGDFDHETIRERKKLGGNGFNFSQVFGGLFGEKFGHSKPGKVKDSGKRELMDADVVNQKQANVLVDFVEDMNLDCVLNGNLENRKTSICSDPFDSNSRSKNGSENHVNGTVVKNKVKHWKKNFADKNGSAESVSERPAYSYENNKSRFVTNQQYYFKDYQDETEAMASCNGTCESVDLSFTMKHTKHTSSFGHQQIREGPDRSYWYSRSTEDDHRESHRYSVKQKPFGPDKPNSFVNQEPARANIFGSSPPSMLDIDLEFNSYLVEANDILKEAKRCVRNQVADDFSENALYESAALLSKAIEMRPMSLLAVGQLGNTYLLHGELKLKKSRELRSLLTRTDSFSVGEVGSVLNSFGNQLADKDKIKLALADVCEECEELLVKAGRKYRVALSIDGNDVRALYNWGLALSFRAQLIADIGPSTAHDADKIFMAAIDKFDAIMSKGNEYAPDALFKWGSVLQHRSQLRPRNSREKVRLLHQARRLYEDALHLDSENPQLQEALSTCVSEIDYWYG